jgi:hypothetical protein
MRNLLTILAIVLFIGTTPAQSNDYLLQKDFKAEKQKIQEGMNAAKKQLNELKKINADRQKSIDSLKTELGSAAGNLRLAADSLYKTSAKLNALQEKVDGEKFMSRTTRMALVVILLLIFAIQFVMLYLFRKRAMQNHMELVELDKKTNERFDLELKNFRTEVQANRDHMANLSNEMNQKLTASLSSQEARIHRQEQQLEEKVAWIGGRIDFVEPAISQLKDEYGGILKTMGERIDALKLDTDQKTRELAAKLEEKGKR